MRTEGPPLFEVKDLAFSYNAGETWQLEIDELVIPRMGITALIGPSGTGKSTLLRVFDRMNELRDEVSAVQSVTNGSVKFKGVEIYDPDIDPVLVRQHVGMVFQEPQPLPKSIHGNIAFGAKGELDQLPRHKRRAAADEIAEETLRQAMLWDEVKDRLGSSALSLSGGQQQRLCIARALAARPNVLLMDEPCSSLDPMAIGEVEETMKKLAHEDNMPIVIVTHNMQQAGRVSQKCAFMSIVYEHGSNDYSVGPGHILEYKPTEELFTSPSYAQTEEFFSLGRKKIFDISTMNRIAHPGLYAGPLSEAEQD